MLRKTTVNITGFNFELSTNSNKKSSGKIGIKNLGELQTWGHSRIITPNPATTKEIIRVEWDRNIEKGFLNFSINP